MSKPGKQVVIASRSFGKTQPEGAEMLLQAGFQLVYLPGNRPTQEELSDAMRRPETVAVIAGGSPITGEMIQSSPNLKIIAMHGVGLSHIDLETAREKGVVVKAVPGGNAEAVADQTWGLLLAVSRKICQADAEIRRGVWGKHFGTSMNQKTLGIIGFGHIGRAVARRARGFEMTILAYDVFKDEEAAAALNTTYVELGELICTSDYITIHVPLLPETRHLIDTPQLEKMKNTAVLINVSRGEVVNETALAEALVEGKIAGAGLDVFSEEPLPENHPLRSAPNTVFTPHDGARTYETIRGIGIACAENILSVVK